MLVARRVITRNAFILDRRLQPCRFQSTDAVLYPFSQLRAFPFQISKAEAIAQIAPFASTAAMFKNLIGSLGARFLPGFGFQPIQPANIMPVYFPAWLVDGEVQLDLTIHQNDDSRRVSSTIRLADTYLPGSDYKVLSAAPLRPSAADSDAVPFTESMHSHDGDQIACLPFNISPLSAAEIIKSSGHREATIDDEFRFHPSTFTTNFCAAYPVLIPLYLAQYEINMPKVEPFMLTFFIEACTTNGNIMAEGVGHTLLQALRDSRAPNSVINLFKEFSEFPVVFMYGLSNTFIHGLSAQVFGPDERLALTLSAWLNDRLDMKEAAPALANKSKGVVTVENLGKDPRVRPYSKEERDANREWMLVRSQIQADKTLIGAMTSTNALEKVVVEVKPPNLTKQEMVDHAVEALRKDLADLEAKRDETEPAWWKEWKQSTGLKTS